MPIPVQIRVRDNPVSQEPISRFKESMEAFLIDISEFGMGLLSQNSLPWGTLLDMEFSRAALPVRTKALSGGLMQVSGRVVQVTLQGNQYRIGISFIRIDESDRDLIQQLSPTTQAARSQERRRAPRVTLVQTAVKPEV